MKGWHALAACAGLAVVLVGFWASGAPSRPRTETSQPAEAGGAPVPEAPSLHGPATATAVETPASSEPAPVPPGQDAAVPVAEDVEKAVLERHVARFVKPDPARRDRDLPKADPEEAEKRRIEQIDLLRQRKATDLLDHIAQGLTWLALQQHRDGGFSPAPIAAPGDEWATATTGLATLALLGFRDQDKAGVFEPTIAQAVLWLRGRQREDGAFGDNQLATAIALYALARAAWSSGSDDLREAVQRGLVRLSAGQAPDGGYRQVPADPGHVYVTAWVAQAVEAARRAKVEVPPEMDLGLRRFLDSVWLGEDRFAQPVAAPGGILLGLIEWDVPKPDGPWACSGDAVLESWRKSIRNAQRERGLRGSGTRIVDRLHFFVRIAIALEPDLPEDWVHVILDLASEQEPSGSDAGSFKDRLGIGVVAETALAVLTMEHAYLRR